MFPPSFLFSSDSFNWPTRSPLNAYPCCCRVTISDLITEILKLAQRKGQKVLNKQIFPSPHFRHLTTLVENFVDPFEAEGRRLPVVHLTAAQLQAPFTLRAGTKKESTPPDMYQNNEIDDSEFGGLLKVRIQGIYIVLLYNCERR